MVTTLIFRVAVTVLICYWTVIVWYGVKMVLNKSYNKRKKYQAHKYR